MRILLKELRQYLRPVTLVICGALVIMWYFFYGKECNLPSQNNDSRPYLLSIEYQQRFGNAIDRAELEQIKAQQAEERAALDALFDETMGQYGLHSKNDFDLLRQAVDDSDGEAYAEAVQVWGEDGLAERLEHLDVCMNIAWSEPVMGAVFREQSMRRVISICEAADHARQAIDTSVSESDWFFSGTSDDAKARLRASLDKGEVSITNAVYDIDSFFMNFVPWNALICMICAVIIMPLTVRNKLTRVKGMQFTSKTGKRIVKEQFAAAVIITVCVNLLIDAFFFAVYFFSKGNTRHLLNCRLNDGALSNMLWLDLTYLEFVLLCFFHTLLLSLTLTCLLFMTAWFSKHYIEAIAAAIPWVIVEVLCFERLVSQLSLFHGSAIGFVLLLMGAIVTAAAAIVFLTGKVRREEYGN